jgi:FKBP-type peptidyl-prolyl cis-trans isomerase 2
MRRLSGLGVWAQSIDRIKFDVSDVTNAVLETAFAYSDFFPALIIQGSGQVIEPLEAPFQGRSIQPQLWRESSS